MGHVRADDRRVDWPLLASALVLLGVHLALIHYFFGGALPDQPYSRGDFATHATQTRRVIAGLTEFGRPWVYDPYLLAGAPNGVIFDADVKAWELWTWALTRAGVGFGRAYNAFVLAVHLCVPFVIYAAARSLRLDRRAALLAAGLGVALWFFDSFTHWMWFIGTITYCLASVFALVPLGLFHRWLADRRPIAALACALSLGLGLLVHPYTFFILVAPMLAMYVGAARREGGLRPREHAMTVGIAAFALLVNLWWLRLALRFSHYLLDSAHYAQGGLAVLVYDLLGLVYDPGAQGMIAPRTAVRLIAVFAAVFGLRAWRRAGDDRWRPFTIGLVVLACLTYLGSYTVFAQIQPYRHSLPLAFMLVIPAAAWLRALPGERPWRAMGSASRALTLVLAALAAIHLCRDVLYFFASSMAERKRLEDGREVVMNTMGHLYIPAYRYTGMDDWERILAKIDELDARDGRRGRWLIQDQVVGEYVMARTDVQVIGGFELRNIEHSDANWFRRVGRDPPFDLDALRRYCETYAVAWIVIREGDYHGWWDEKPQRALLSRAAAADGLIVYRVRGRPSLLDGRGTVEVGVNRIAVHGSDPARDLTLRFHWLETLRCSPDCRLERVDVRDDRVGFIRVSAPHPADFEVTNAYGE